MLIYAKENRICCYCIIVVKVKADHSLVQLELALILHEDKMCIFPYPCDSKFSSSSRAGKVLNFGAWGQDLVMLHVALEEALARDRRLEGLT